MLTGPQPPASDSKLNNIKLTNWILAGSVAIALVCLLFGLLQNRRLSLEKRQLEFQLQRTANAEPCNSPRLGDIVPPIEGDTSNGKRIKTAYNGASKYLLFFLSFKCKECVKELPIWNEIAKRAMARNVIVLGLVTDKEEAILNDPDRVFDILTVYDAALLRAYRITVTPTVMLVSERGRTQWVQVGSLNEAATQELLSIVNKDIVIE